MSHFALPHLPVLKASGTIDELAQPLLRLAAAILYNAISSDKRHDESLPRRSPADDRCYRVSHAVRRLRNEG